jgi:hypothetical protein
MSCLSGSNVLSALHAAQAATNIITTPTQFRIIGQQPATRLKIVDIAEGLILSPGS